MRMSVVAAIAAAFAASWSGVASAKDLTGRLGVGYESTLPSSGGAGLNGVSARFWVNNQLFVGGQLGVLIVDPDVPGADTQTNFGLGANAGFAFIDEPNLNVYGGGGLAFGSVSGTNAAGESEGKTAIGLNVGVGAEFFFVGLPNLGFTTFYGLSYTSVEDVASVIQIGGGEFATFGIRYYFGGPTGPGR